VPAAKYSVFFRPIEDLFDKVESQVARVEDPQVWSSRVRKLRQQRGMSPVKSQTP